MQGSCPFHSLSAYDSGNLHQGFYIIIGLEERKFPGKKEQQDHTRRPHINGWWSRLNTGI
jgi:hypothetical protein